MNAEQTTRPPRRSWWMLASFAMLGFVMAEVPGCKRADQPVPAVAASAATPTRVPVVTATRQTLTQTVRLPGTVEGVETADLYAKVGGFLAQINVDIGDEVEANEVLAVLSIPEMQKEHTKKEAAVKSAEARVQQAEAAIVQAEAGAVSAAASLEEATTRREEKEAELALRATELDRTAELVEAGSLIGKKLDEAKFGVKAAQAALKSVEARIKTADANLDAAKADIDRARLDLDSAKADAEVATASLEQTAAILEYAVIQAPFSGVITKRAVDRGAFIRPAEGNSAAKPLLTVSRVDEVRIFLDLPMGEVRWLDRGDRAVLSGIDLLPGEEFEGVVSRYSAVLDRTSRMMRVEIDLENPENRLLPGYYGNVSIDLNEFPDTPVVPSSAVMADDEGSYVYIVVRGVIERRAITAHYEDGTIVGVESGLEGGEHVVAAGGGQYTVGQSVVAVESD